ncbi:MAG: LacI family transcriptional regulator [Acidimicrobiia bacterium]
MEPRGAARLVDVAERAGVTVSTASRALSRPDMVRPATRARVEAAARALQYEPNRMARSLITGRSTAIAAIIPAITNSYFAVICQAARQAAGVRGFDFVIVETDGDPAREREAVRAASQWSAGMIICSARRAHGSHSSGVPIVYANRRSRGAHGVVLDQQFTVETQIEHLLDLGHERILWVSGPKGLAATEARLRHVRRLAVHHDIRIVYDVPPSATGGVRLAEELHPEVTAVAVFADSQAVGFLSRASQLGISVPGDVSLIGADDIPVAEFTSPPLTTVHAPKEQMGRAAVSLLLDHHWDDSAVILETLRGHLVVRGSTAPPRGVRAST